MSSSAGVGNRTQRRGQGSFSGILLVWILVVQNVLFLALEALKFYVDDGNSNVIHVLWMNERIKRAKLFLGQLCILLDLAVFLCSALFFWSIRSADPESEIPPPSTERTINIILLLELLALYQLSITLWPIRRFFTSCLVLILFVVFFVMLFCLLILTSDPEVKTNDHID